MFLKEIKEGGCDLFLSDKDHIFQIVSGKTFFIPFRFGKFSAIFYVYFTSKISS